MFLCMHKAQQKLKSVEDQRDLGQLTALFRNQRFQNALSIHKAVVSASLKGPQPVPVYGSGGLQVRLHFENFHFKKYSMAQFLF